MRLPPTPILVTAGLAVLLGGLLLWLPPYEGGEPDPCPCERTAADTTDSWPSGYTLRACKADLERMEQLTGWRVERARRALDSIPGD